MIFKQSDVPAHSELNTLFSMFTPVGWLERVPTYKDQQAELAEKDLNTFGFLGYPLLQAADILLYTPHFVPVGADQVAHVELTREVARRFNSLYPGAFFTSPEAAPWEMNAILEKARKLAGEPKDSTRTDFSPHQLFEAASQTKKVSPFGRREILPEPQVLLTPSPKVPGLDGRKMSKSYNNHLMLSEPEADLRAKLKVMVTDPARVRRDDPGNPEVCPVGDLHKVFSDEETIAKAVRRLHARHHRLHRVQDLVLGLHRPHHRAHSGAPPRPRKAPKRHQGRARQRAATAPPSAPTKRWRK